MGKHKTTIVPAANGQWQAQCSCRKVSKVVKDYLGALDWEDKHHHEIERVHQHQARTPSLKDQRDYYRERAEDYSQSDQDRALWTQLAEELDHRLGERINVDRPQLF